VLAAITRVVHDLGITVLLAEHRLERVVQYADSMVEVLADGTVRYGPPAAVMADSAVAPPVVELGRAAGWNPLALSVRDARRLAPALRERVAAVPPFAAHHRSGAAPVTVLRARRVLVRYGDLVAVNEVDLELRAGEVTALMGRNGSGKSSLLWALQGSGPRQGGSVDVGGVDPRALSRSRARRAVGLVPQTPTDLLYLDTVAAELAQADRESGPTDRPGAEPCAQELLERLVPGIDRTMHPRDLSEGQRLALVLAIQLRAAPTALLLDEPTRGLDYQAKQGLSDVIDLLAAAGHAVLISTHDVEFAATASDRVVVLADGDVVADGATAQVLTGSPAFAPQVAKVMAPLPYLTVGQLRGQVVP
jgi:energy-coupling factor transporter ATP-binding protein EcfA2